MNLGSDIVRFDPKDPSAQNAFHKWERGGNAKTQENILSCLQLTELEIFNIISSPKIL